MDVGILSIRHGRSNGRPDKLLHCRPLLRKEGSSLCRDSCIARSEQLQLSMLQPGQTFWLVRGIGTSVVVSLAVSYDLGGWLLQWASFVHG